MEKYPNLFLRLPVQLPHTRRTETARQGTEQYSGLGGETWFGAHLGCSHPLPPQSSCWARSPGPDGLDCPLQLWWSPSSTMLHVSVLNTIFSEAPTPHSSNPSWLWINWGCSDTVCTGLALLCFGTLSRLGTTSNLICLKHNVTMLLIKNNTQHIKDNLLKEQIRQFLGCQ